MDALFSDADLDIDTWNDGEFGDIMLDTLMPRSGSDMSIASTMRDPTPSLVIEAFCTFNMTLVHIEYPIAENGWQYRPDQGGHSSHRWDLGHEVCIVAKHSTCAKAMRPKDKACRNCENKKRWRRECQEACNTFFIYALTDVGTASCALMTLVLRYSALSFEDQKMWAAFAPKIQYKDRMDNVGESRMQSMVCRERNLRYSILNGGTGRARYDDRSLHAGDHLLQLLMSDDNGSARELTPSGSSFSEVAPNSEVAPEDSDADDATTTDMPTDVLCVPDFHPIVAQPPLHCEPAAVQLSTPLAPLIATPISKRQKDATCGSARSGGAVVASVVSSPMRNRDATVSIYEMLLTELLSGVSGVCECVLTTTLSQEALCFLVNRLPHNEHDATEVVENDVLGKCFSIIGSTRTPKMLIKSALLSIWVVAAHARSKSITLHTGYLSMHSVAVFDEMCKLPLLPCAVTQREVHVHASYETAKSATLPGTHPIMCAYYAPHALARVYASHVLPIGF